MTVCIIGWYGTETIGDRAILTGIFSFLQQSCPGFKVKLGSLNPYFSERTIIEDQDLYQTIIPGHKIEITLFNSTKATELKQAVKTSDITIMGGGPLMHINAMFMIEYAFKLAKKAGKKTIVFGCGVGPLNKKRHQKATLSIVKNSDYTILRDHASKTNLEQLSKDLGVKLNSDKIYTSLDPAVQCLLYYQKLKPPNNVKEEYIAINLREFPSEYALENKASRINNLLLQTIETLSEKFENTKIRLIPMHYFHIGNDDRIFLNKIAIQLNKANLEVQNVNLTLEQTMAVFTQATINIGMRFHAVVFQTILNGKNFILDYTEPRKGKISGFLTDIDGKDFYKSRYINLQQTDLVSDTFLADISSNDRFVYDRKSVEQKLETYNSCLRNLL